MSSNKETAKQIIQIIGEDNITFMTHCATRLRMNVADENKVDLNALDQVSGVIKAQIKSGQLQVIIGAKVAQVFEEASKLVSLSDNQVQSTEIKKNIIARVVEAISGCFGPVIPVLIGCGMVKSVAAILTTLNLVDPTSGTYQIISLIGDLLFYFFPFFLAVSAAKKFKTHEFLAVALAGALMYPTIQNGALQAAETGVNSLSFLGLPVLFVNYKSTIIPIILSVWIMSYVYKWVNKLIPDTFKVLFVPMIVLFIMVPLELIVIGPFGTYLGQGVAKVVSYLYTTNGVLGALLFGTFRPLLIIFGMHYAITPINAQLIAEYGYSVISPANLTGNLAQAGATLATFFFLKKKSEKAEALSAGVTALFGVTEPAMFGFNLKYKKPMICAMIAGGIGAAYINFWSGGATAVILPGLLALPTYIADNYIHIIIGISISIALAMIGTLVFGIGSKPKADDTTIVSATKLDVKPFAKGEVVELNKVNDAVFSTGVMGNGFAIVPTEGKVFAPFAGKVTMVFETKHAIGLRSDNGVEVLVHIGLDTVNLKGEHFNVRIKEGDTIEAGQLLVEFDLEKLKELGYDTIIPFIVTNGAEFAQVTPKLSSDSIEFALA
ncbi:TPA: PTS glucose transporter subunit IIA [Streptococcus suis]|uniref:PTS system beta-glucosides-specific transporter subunit IIABC n=1 Tax=Streptococcus suis TaxID=1307 RepID=A0A0Z8J3K2_STRSU|nr:beta-glucoside-specific PTS transporter subunit IIABC [Streptococcus suis]ASW51786.1 PTS beta-glucoside transporter subunit EIIBCA [Streptococcus suis]AXI65408.1 PTS beta-glucoside transporter subunit EIIBCA [Streptococcus suis]MBO8110785.1 PTS beta-glucoside transporter subunit EIIBCA [Streptococcus suis]MBS8080217.1 PTS beta-glucoside transporter subunit EIIBCA [Streptococcus suis]MCB2852627.1 PTS glucose transporter subunit IIA [Streptococcus suis]